MRNIDNFGLLVLLCVALLTAACDESAEDEAAADDDQSVPPSGLSDLTGWEQPCAGRVAAMFDPRPLTSNLPYPSDLFTVEDPATTTGLRVNLDRRNTPLIDELMITNSWLYDHINRTDGFGVSSHAFLPLFNDDDGVLGLPTVEGSIEPDSSVLLIELGPDKLTPSGQVRFEAVHRPYMDQIELSPILPLKSATTYLVVLTDKVTDSDGDALCPTWLFHAVRSREPVDSDEATADLEPLRREWAPYFDVLEASPWNLQREHIVQMTPFITCSVEQDLINIREQLVQMAEADPPGIQNMQVSGGGSMSHVGAVVRGSIPMPTWQDEDGTFVLNPDAHEPIQQGEELINFILTIPKPAEAWGQPFPVVISLHGIASRKEALLSFADDFAEAGFAVIGIDDPFHGDRADPDGWDFEPSFKILALGDPLRMRDNMREAVAEHICLVRAIEAMVDLDVSPYSQQSEGDGLADLDTESLFTFGHSLGALLNTMLAVAEPDIMASAGAAGGGGWANVVLYSPYLDTALTIFRLLGMDFDWPPDTTRIFFLWYQGLVDPGDSNSYSRFLLRDPMPGVGERPYLMQEGIGDSTIDNEVTHIYSMYADIPLLEPYVVPVEGLRVLPTPAESWGLFQYPTDEHEFFFSGEYRDEAREQVLHFYTTALEAGTGEIIDPLDKAGR